MSKRVNIKKLEDMAGYLSFCAKAGVESNIILLNLSHDIFGILRDDKCFLPRTHGYRKYLRKEVKDNGKAE